MVIGPASRLGLTKIRAAVCAAGRKDGKVRVQVVVFCRLLLLSQITPTSKTRSTTSAKGQQESSDNGRAGAAVVPTSGIA
jgi:hypothetical protein